MKTIISTVLVGVAAAALPACVGFEPDTPDKFEGDGLPPEVDLCSGCLKDQELRGELMLLVNTKPTDGESNFTSNFPLDNDGRFVGNALYLYDPARVCEGGGSGCRLAKLGNLWLDEAMGAISVNDRSLQRFTVRDLAWHPELGLWGLSYDPLNDEWGVATLAVPDWTRSDNRIVSARYAFRYGDVQDEATDDCYWRQSMTGLEFVGDELYAGSAGKPGNGLDARGAVFRIDPAFVASPAHCVLPSDYSMDPEYYACGEICSAWRLFDEKLGISGDMAPATDAGMPALVRAEMSETFPTARHALYRVETEGDPPGTAPSPLGPYVDDVAAGFEIEGLARIGGALYGIDTTAKVYKITEPTAEEPDKWRFEVHDDLSGLFTAADRSLRIRGATTVVVP